MKKILVIAPHLDDEVLGCGGTIARHVREGDWVECCFIANRIYDHQFDEDAYQKEVAHSKAAQEILGYHEWKSFELLDEWLSDDFPYLIDLIAEEVEIIKPSVIYICHEHDLHQDHHTVFDASMIALRYTETRRIFSYEVPSSTPFSMFKGNYFVSLNKVDFFNKINAWKQYRTEQREYPHPRSVEAIETLARMRGVECGEEIAEAFILLRGKR